MHIPPLDHQLDVPAGLSGTISDQNLSITAFYLLCPDATMVIARSGFALKLDEKGVLEWGGDARWENQ